MVKSYISKSILNFYPNKDKEYEPYTYAPLPDEYSIRLLYIFPGDSPQIHCSLQSTSLRSHLPYNALSYTWGDPRTPLFQTIASAQYLREHRIICDGRLFFVTENLWHALERLRSERSKTTRGGVPYLQEYVWIDAICINQQDPVERSFQVKLMDQIYKGAQLVVAWLGKTDRYTERALRLVAQLSEITQWSDNYLDQRDKHASLETKFPDLTPKDWESLAAFFHRAYFHRAWIFQEIILARHITFFWDSSTVLWETLLRCSQYLFSTGAWLPLNAYVNRFSGLPDRVARRATPIAGPFVAALAELKAEINHRTDTGAISYAFIVLVLGTGRGLLATDSRDHIYSRLGVVKSYINNCAAGEEAQLVINRLPIPDYRKSVETVYIEFAEWLLDISQDLLVLSLVEDRTCRAPQLLNKLPSWVPDQSVAIAPMSFRFICNSPQWNPAGPASAGIGAPIDGRLLAIRGGFFDTVKQTADPFNDMKLACNWTSISHLIGPYLTAKYPMSNSTYATALRRTMIADSDMFAEHPPLNCPADSSMARALNEWLVIYLGYFGKSKKRNYKLSSHYQIQRMLLLGVLDQLNGIPRSFAPCTSYDIKLDFLDHRELPVHVSFSPVSVSAFHPKMFLQRHDWLTPRRQLINERTSRERR